ncbi:MAG: HD domain-containing protein [Roseburia sp.]|nr:HD domain-containing protein [Roseburia sp.]MCM1557807.1 HD domain-containing protein [Anaeroplasma bactoclasticum]
MPKNVPEKYVFLHILLVESIRIAALLHDIGHPPFSHVIEFALKDIYEKLKEKTSSLNAKEKEFFDCIEKYFNSSHKLHEEMGNEIVQTLLKSFINRESSTSDFDFFICSIVKKILNDNGYFVELHRIIDGIVDSDRLDYVSRDPKNSGLKFESIEIERIINDTKIFLQNGEINFVFSIKALSSIEIFLKQRFYLYKYILYHHRVLKTDMLLRNSVERLIEDYFSKEYDSNFGNDENEIPNNIAGLWYPLNKVSTIEKANALSQWNDSWLIVILRKIYFSEYYLKELNNDKYIIYCQLNELLQNDRHYFPLIKRYIDYKVLDDQIKFYFENDKNFDIIEKRIKKLESKFKTGEKDTVTINPILKLIRSLHGEISGSTLYCIYFIESLFDQVMEESKKENKIEKIQEQVQTTIINTVKEMFGEKYQDTMVLFKKISNGLESKSKVLFYDDYDNLHCLDDVSPVITLLSEDAKFWPAFHVYILVHNDIKIDKEALLKQIGINIAKVVLETISRMLAILLLKNKKKKGKEEYVSN